MRVRATKLLAKFLNQHAPKDYVVYHDTLSLDRYQMWHGDAINNTRDYNATTQKFNTIVVSYPPQYYAPNLYLSTNDLIKISKTKNYINDFLEYIEI